MIYHSYLIESDHAHLSELEVNIAIGFEHGLAYVARIRIYFRAQTEVTSCFNSCEIDDLSALALDDWRAQNSVDDITSFKSQRDVELETAG